MLAAAVAACGEKAAVKTNRILRVVHASLLAMAATPTTPRNSASEMPTSRPQCDAGGEQRAYQRRAGGKRRAWRGTTLGIRDSLTSQTLHGIMITDEY